MSHTPGPWAEYTVAIIQNAGHDEEVFEIAKDGTHPTVAYVHTAADAHLIAAAPDLLAALHRALVELEDPHGATKASAVAEIRAAIAKARGVNNDPAPGEIPCGRCGEKYHALGPTGLCGTCEDLTDKARGGA